ncbi:MAG: efflux RND transporter periplasmic adaptor subunit [Betaproteobacteria bacterium]|jgi:HlyD family secretion protein
MHKSSNQSQRNEDKEIRDLLGSSKERKLSLSKRQISVLLCVGAALIIWGLWPSTEPRDVEYQTEEAKIGSLVVTISATGNLKPTNQIEVGSELSGIMDSVLVDENESVTRNQPLARLDTARLVDAVEQSKAVLAEREANVEQIRATVSESKLHLYRLRQLYDVTKGKSPSKTEIDAAVANFRRAQANEKTALSAVQQAQANLRSDQTNLTKATLISPINGVVLKRSVEPGQTVAASFQAPVLFTIAEDLKKMELHVDVDEADVGQVLAGQDAAFTVDAWPEREYQAKIKRISFAAEVKDNVVTYPAVLDVENTDLTLRPGMTGTALITTLKLDQQLLVPNAAFRVDLSPHIEKEEPKGVFGFLFPRPKQPSPKVRTQQKTGVSQLWILRNGQPIEVSVEIIATNQKYSAIRTSEINPETRVIVELVSER